ncbi:MAG TPA: MMPL family transporter [Myxococcota bacterium]|nr:MMPL family transporter [Myxococcota bacterium]
MKRYAELVASRPRIFIAAVLLVTLGLASELRHLHLEIKLQDEVPRGHPYMAIDDRLRARLGAQQTSLIAIGVHEGDIFNPDTLRRIQRLTEGVAKIPGVIPSTILSLAAENAKAISATGDDVRVEPLMTTIPRDTRGLAELRKTVFSYPMYVGSLVTRDARGAMILADFTGDVSSEKITAALEALASQERNDRTDVYVGGQSPALAALNGATRGIVPLVAVALFIIAIVHYEAFRTLQAVFLPLVTAVLSVVWSLGITALLGFQLTPWTAMTAVLVLSVAAGHAVQILKRYYECYRVTGDSREAVIQSLERIGPVMLAACSVAAAGFMSLATFGIPAVRDFGVMAAFGILSTLVLELSFIPACRAVLRAPRSAEAGRERTHRVLEPALDWLVTMVCRRPKAVLVAGAIVVLCAAAGTFRLEINSSFRSWFRRTAPVIVADREIRKSFTGTSTIRVLVEGDRPDTLLDPQVVRGLAELEATLAREPAITNVVSFADYTKVMNRAMHEGDANAYTIPETHELIAQYALLYGRDDLSRVVSPDYRAGAVLALSRSDNVAWVQDLFARLRQVGATQFPADVHVEVAGGELAQALAMNDTVVHEKLLNMLQVGSVIFILSALVFRSAIAGLFVLVPLISAALVNLGLMGWIHSWLSFATATYTAMGVSLGADFAIYLLFRLREEVHLKPLEDAMREALLTSGRAILFVASAIAAGNVSLLASDFALWRQLGGYVALMMGTSALAALSLLPALVLVTRPRFLSAPERRDASIGDCRTAG